MQNLNNFFSNTVRNVKVPEYANCKPSSTKVNDSVSKSIIKYRNQWGILIIGKVYNKQQESHFTFSNVDKKQMLKKILGLDSVKASQDSYFHKISPKKIQIFFNFLLSDFNHSIRAFTFPSSSNWDKSISVWERRQHILWFFIHAWKMEIISW